MAYMEIRIFLRFDEMEADRKRSYQSPVRFKSRKNIIQKRVTSFNTIFINIDIRSNTSRSSNK